MGCIRRENLQRERGWMADRGCEEVCQETEGGRDRAFCTDSGRERWAEEVVEAMDRRNDQGLQRGAEERGEVENGEKT